jgi:hypothetical protein
MDLDTTRGAATAPLCFRCKKPGHFGRDCPTQFDVRSMTIDKLQEVLFRDLIAEGVVVVYLDDILIFTETIEQHREVTRCVLKLLEENQLFLKPDKCEFDKTKVEYLGVIISHNNSVEMDPVKIAGVTEWPTPTSKKEVQLGNGTGHPRGHQTLTRTLTRRHPDPKPVEVSPTRATP